jgi:uncharacterized protein YkwD
MKIILPLMLLFLLSCGKDSGSSSSGGSSSSPLGSGGVSTSQTHILNAPRDFTEHYIEIMNNHRRRQGVGSLIAAPELNQIAKKHAENMALGLFSHLGFKYRAKEARAAMGGGNLFGEIIANGQNNPQAVLESWINSSNHRYTLEGESYTHTGFGYYQDKRGEYYWVQIFLEMD